MVNSEMSAGTKADKSFIVDCSVSSHAFAYEAL